MRTLGTQMVCTVESGAGVHVGACWDGGENIAVFVHINGQPRRVIAWPIWNPVWDAPLIEPTRDSFERFVVGQLAQPGVLAELIETAAAS